MQKKVKKIAMFLENHFLGISLLEAGVSLGRLCSQRILRPLEKQHYRSSLEKGYLDICAYIHIIWLHKDPYVLFPKDRKKKS